MSSFARYPSLAGRVVIVSGGASGIGEGFVRNFAANGARVAFLDMQEQAGAALADAIAATGAEKPFFLQCNLLDIAALKAALAEIRAKLGPAAVLINNAADDRRANFEEITTDEFDRMIGVNLRHVFFAAQQVIPQMREAGFGSIINLTSSTWMRGVQNLEAYSAAKAAIVGFTNSLARDVGKWRIRANALMPGLVLTEKQRRLWWGNQADIDKYLEAQCIPEVVEADDLARTALFLAADDSRMITKQVFIVNGGMI
ncbi:MAG TPA: SDR family oxidoreductase [Magnetospirillaceae bacterium]|jgi:NAD(P)-dependent dehydrogenase (short-subunit alcohol dehydrogenase family)